MADTAVSYRGTGKRKTSVARVVLVPGSGAITVNGKPLEEYFPRQTCSRSRPAPLRAHRHRLQLTTSAPASTAAASPARPARCATASRAR